MERAVLVLVRYAQLHSALQVISLLAADSERFRFQVRNASVNKLRGRPPQYDPQHVDL